MIARRSVWSDDRVKALLAEFIPAADEVHSLQSGKDPAALHFQKIAEQGHYAGRTKPTNTRQGIYAAAPSGILLASMNNNRPEQVAKMLEQALAKWRSLSDDERYLPSDQLKTISQARRWERLYPQDGLAIRVNSRDLPRDNPTIKGWRADAWNQDFLWLKRDEAIALCPQSNEVGAARPWPDAIARRLARLNLVDNVRGQIPAFADEDIEHVTITSTIESIDDASVTIRIDGRSRTVKKGRWSIDGFKDMDNPTEQERGIDVELFGHAVFDRSTQRFVEFEVVAIGTRWGATQYNGRADDRDPNGIGFLLSLADDHERVPPASIWAYGW